MELPIQLKFFRKLELYQELKDENNKAIKAKRTLREIWRMEKTVLKFADQRHHHRGSILENKDIQYLLEEANFSNKSIEGELCHIAKNLISRGFAEFATEDKDINKGFYITKEGFLMGKVINEVEEGKRRTKFFYEFFYYLVWTSAISGAILIILKLLQLLYPPFESFLKNNLCKLCN